MRNENFCRILSKAARILCCYIVQCHEFEDYEYWNFNWIKYVSFYCDYSLQPTPLLLVKPLGKYQQNVTLICSVLKKMKPCGMKCYAVTFFSFSMLFEQGFGVANWDLSSKICYMLYWWRATDRVFVRKMRMWPLVISVSSRSLSVEYVNFPL